MRLICVGGLSSECGKTSVACLLLKAFPGWAAMKVVPSELNAVCRRGRTCKACQPPDGLYAIMVETNAATSKDTAAFLRAGAGSAALVRALPRCIAAAMRAALSGLVVGQAWHDRGVIIESTTAMPLISGLRIMVARPGSVEIKQSAQEAAKCADLVVINESEDSPGVDAKLPGELAHKRRVTACAVLPPDHPRNRTFIAICSEYIENAYECGIAEPG